MKTKIFIITAMLSAGMSAKAQSEQIIEAVSPSKQVELPLKNKPKLVIGSSVLTFTDNTNSTKFPKDERLVIRIKKDENANGIASASHSKATTPKVIYSIDGKRQNALKQGFNIVRQDNGEVKKIIVKQR